MQSPVQSFASKYKIPHSLSAIRCTLPSCRCECFSPGKSHLRTCDSCKHGWVAHALDKLGYRSMYQLGMQVEIVQPNIVFDIASLMLYGAQATPIRLKILLDRLFSVLQHEEVLQVLHGFGWSYEDYARGYILQDDDQRYTPKRPNTQDPAGGVLDKWTIATREEEQLIMQQFLRFGETKSIAQEIILQDARENREKQSGSSPRTESEIKRFIERSNIGMQSFMRGYDAHHFLARPGVSYPTVTGSSRLLSPPSVPSYSPTSVSREGSMVLPVATASPVVGSPLTRLQGMQPFDYRKEHITPTVSPSASEKSHVTVPGDNLSPQNLTISTSRTLSTPPTQLSLPLLTRSDVPDEKMTPTSTATSDSGDIKDDSDVAINYSIKDTNSNSSSVYAENKLKHLRKSANPMKRPWQPTPGYGGTLISPSGKKRVLCTACNKTFCDKGALKIHYSAVHLKEMHKCSVDGCNMMFSSRRSRNRHSANPNPKLHMPQTRRKLPEGVTVLDEKSPLGASMSTASLSNMMPSPDPRAESNRSTRSSSSHSRPDRDMVLKQEPDSSMCRTPVMPEPLYFLDPRAHPGPMMEAMLPSKVPKLEPQPLTPPPAHSNKYEQSRRKRKSLAPTRCAQTEEVFVMSDENSNDGMSAENTSDYEGIVIEAPTSDAGERSPKDGYGSETSSKNDQDLNKSNSSNNNNDFKSETSSPSPKGSFHAIKENAIRQMDSISQLHLKDMCVDGCDDPRDNSKVINKENETIMNLSDKHEGDRHSDLDGSVSDNGYLEGEGIDDYSEDDLEDSLDSPSATNGDSPTNGMDVPIDRDNPRKCPACGKMFQNHFGVKTHYQNVHLKLMHTCTVEGCNAAFPSKRSRDRHSGNLNLHRKLLSTSSSDTEKVSTRSLMNQSLREEFLPRIYESQQFQANSFGPHATHLEGGQDINSSDISASGVVSSTDNQTGISSTTATAEETNGNSMNRSDGEQSPEHTVSYNHQHQSLDEDSGDIELPQPDPDGSVSCHICNKPFRDNLVLKEHFEKVHPKEMYHCTIRGCEKIFSTRKSRNRHSQNDNLHRHITSPKTNGVTA